jgi:hypothetical protein
VLARHADAAYRQAHMRCLNIAAWREGDQPPHMAAFDRLHDVVEFAANGQALQRETRLYLQRFLPAPFRHAEDLTALDATAQTALRMLSPVFQNLLVHASGTAWESGHLITAAWAFATQPLHAAGPHTVPMQAWGDQAAAPYRPAIVGLADPVGIAIDLNGLAIQRSVEFTDDNSRKWKYETAQLIAGLKAAVEHGAVQTAQHHAQAEVDQLAAASQGTIWLAPQGRQTMAQLQQGVREEIERHGEAIAAQAWDRDYRERIHAQAWERYLGIDAQPGLYQQELDAFARQTLQPLDQAYVSWLRSQALSCCFTHQFDPHDARSGEAYLDVVRLLVAQASGRSAVFQLLSELLQQDPNDPQAWLMRALALNHEPLIQAWSAVSWEKANASALSWAEIAEQFHDHYREIVALAIETQINQTAGSTYANKAARLIYEIAGPLTLQLSQAIDRLATAALPTRFHMGVLSMIAKVDQPQLEIVDLRGMWSRQQAARTLAGLLASLTHTQAHAYRSGARVALDKLPADDTPHPYRGVMLIDKAKATLLAGSPKGERNAVMNELLTPQQFDQILQESLGKPLNLDVKIGIVQLVLSGITLSNAYREMIQAKPGEEVDKAVNFAGGLAAVIGLAATAAGKGLASTPLGAARLAKQYKFFAIEVETRAQWLTGVGTLFGAVGGIIAGALAITDGWSERNGNHRALAVWSIFAGGASVVIALVPILFSIGAIGALAFGVAGLIIAFVLAVVSYLKPNAVQDWLERTMDFGIGKQKFDGPVAQLQALQALQQGS